MTWATRFWQVARAFFAFIELELRLTQSFDL